jgi:hypothetical protein
MLLLMEGVSPVRATPTFALVWYYPAEHSHHAVPRLPPNTNFQS